MKLERDKVLEFLMELSGPVGPEGLAGFGSELSQKIIGDPLNAIDDAKNEWVQAVDVEQGFNCLLEIACNPPGKEFNNDFYTRFKQNWTFSLAELIYLLGKKNPSLLGRELVKYENDAMAKVVINDVRGWMADDNN